MMLAVVKHDFQKCKVMSDFSTEDLTDFFGWMVIETNMCGL